MIGTFNDDTATFHGAVSKSMAALSKNARAAQASPDTAAFVHALALALGDVRAHKDAAAQAALTPQARYAIEITQLYVTLLERIPEPSALLSAIESRRQGRPFEAIAGDILASDEIQGKLARTLDNPAFVDALFAQTLGRAPGTDERAALLGKLARAELTRAQLVTGLIADTDAYRGGDAQILAGLDLLGARIDTALAQGAAALTRYFAALGQNGFDKRLGDALSAAARRYADIHRSVLESTTTGAAVLHTAPDRMRVDRWGNTLSVNDPRDPRDPNAQTRTTYNANNQVLETTLPAVARPAGTDDDLRPALGRWPQRHLVYRRQRLVHLPRIQRSRPAGRQRHDTAIKGDCMGKETAG